MTWYRGSAVNEADRATWQVDELGIMPHKPGGRVGGLGTQVVGGPISIRGQGRR
jgi:hypothetical protein